MDTVVNGANTAWVLTSAALVLLMTPGLAFSYGGMSRSKSVLNMLMMSFSSLGVVSVLWVGYGYAISFGSSEGGLLGFSSGLIGLDDLVRGVTVDAAENGVVNTFGLPDLAQRRARRRRRPPRRRPDRHADDRRRGRPRVRGRLRQRPARRVVRAARQAGARRRLGAGLQLRPHLDHCAGDQDDVKTALESSGSTA